MSLCKYKNLFGEVNTGIHTVRIFNIAIFDVLFTIIGGILIQFFLLRVFSFYIDLTLVLHRPKRKMRQNSLFFLIM